MKKWVERTENKELNDDYNSAERGFEKKTKKES